MRVAGRRMKRLAFTVDSMASGGHPVATPAPKLAPVATLNACR